VTLTRKTAVRWLASAAVLASAGLVPPPVSVHATSPSPQLYVEPDDGVAPLVSFINSAQHTLDGEIYLASSKPILSALEAAAARYVTIRIGIEEHPYGTGSAAPQLVYRTLASHGIQVEWTSRAFTYTHAKYLVADNARAWIGTMNWTASAFKGNREFAIVDSDSAVVREAEDVFTADWAQDRYTGADDALVLSPMDARAQITAVISHASRSLDIYAEELSDPGISQALQRAVHRGVRVRLVTIPGDNIGRLATTIPMVVRLTRLYVHAKVIIADGATMYLGSENYSATSLDKNRELGLIVRDAGIIRRVESTFTHDLGRTRSPAQGTAPSKATATATTSHARRFLLTITISPNPMSYGAYPTVTIHTVPAAVCQISVRYSTGRGPVSYPDHAARADGAGTIME
jgi:cardiolipin synthase